MIVTPTAITKLTVRITTRFGLDAGTPWSGTKGVGDGVGGKRTTEEYTQSESEKDGLKVMS